MLTPCKECKNAISSEAVVCPHCGIKLQPTGSDKILKRANDLAWLYVAFMIIGGIISIIWVLSRNH